MGGISHVGMFYETRFSVPVSDSDPANNPNTDLNRVPEAAEIHVEDGEDREVQPEDFELPNTDGYEMAQFFIGRAMLDPTVTVVPL